MSADEFLPVELVFNPNWWHHAAGICFDESFYLDIQTRMANDVAMRRVLYQRYGDMGLGEARPEPRPVVGSLHVAGGFVIPALLGARPALPGARPALPGARPALPGARIRFASDAAPQPEPLSWSTQQVEALEKPDWPTMWPMAQIIAGMDALEAEHGYLVGDLNTDGLLNAAYHLYGQQLFLDFYEAPARVRRVLDIIAELIVDIALYVRGRTGSCSISVNRMAARVDPRLFLHANCSVQMISPTSYRQMHLPVEQAMARRIEPFGVHHCGDNTHRLAPIYAELPLRYLEVGWGSDVAACRRVLPDVFLNLRLSPVRMLQASPDQIAADVEALLRAAGPLERVGVCCINMDHGTPDDNLWAMFEVIRRYRRYGA